jgi:hypothetical protein
MTIPSSPIRLSDSQLDAIFAAATPLQPQARENFLRELAQLLAAQPELGDGSLHRLLVEVQRRHFDPPAFATDNGGKYSRLHRRARSA